jgi:hypothetical protein
VEPEGPCRRHKVAISLAHVRWDRPHGIWGSIPG